MIIKTRETTHDIHYKNNEYVRHEIKIESSIYSKHENEYKIKWFKHFYFFYILLRIKEIKPSNLLYDKLESEFKAEQRIINS